MSELAEIKARLARKGIIDDDIGDLLAVYVNTRATWLEAVARIETDGYLSTSPQHGRVPSPWVAIRDNAAATLERLGRRLGLSPDHTVAPSSPRWGDYADVLNGDDE